ncbi:MAG: M50 family metallopeptidase [Candidatus Marsarchaeota archaeon]|nr:M50 family metallopeptidase [Candidatus Marsarchaeota archaeon]
MTAERSKKSKLRHRAAMTAALVPIAFLIIALLYYWNPGTGNWIVGMKFAVAIIALWIIGSVIVRVNGLGKEDAYGGMFIIGSRRGVGVIEWLARSRPRAWDFFAQVGLVISFGALSYVLFRKQIGWKALATGMVALALLLFIVLPFTGLLLNFITIPGLHVHLSSIQLQLPQLSYLFVLELVSLFAGGFALFVVALLGYAAASIAYSVLSFTGTAVVSHVINTTILSNQIPYTIEPVLPGIDIPLLAGILALAVTLIVHEFSHGILFTAYRKKVKRVGLIIFGVIPVGGFADAGEKEMRQLSIEHQNKVLVAGVMANFLFALVFFVPAFLMMSYVAPGLYRTEVVIGAVSPGYPAYNVLTPGSVIAAWNGHNVTGMDSLQAAAAGDAPNTIVTVQTSNGTYGIRANPSGKIGVSPALESVTRSGAYYAVANFLYEFVVLAFALNFFVGIFNLVPLPIGVDGWRIYRNSIRSRKILKALTWIVAIIFIMLILPWVWYFMGL